MEMILELRRLRALTAFLTRASRTLPEQPKLVDQALGSAASGHSGD
jgi:hypothetical protein